MRPLWFLATLILMAPAFAADNRSENLCFNGDFELTSTESPPPGWAMWGAQVYKNPANYTRDTTTPHGGQACFRLFHPANTAGYIVSAPDKALHAEAGRMLQVSFWARTDKPGPSEFLFTAYETVNPFVDAPSPGGLTINVGAEWQQFRFTVYEGWDYFADRSKLILLSFIPTRDQALEKTVWIDDVVLTQEPTTKPGRMVDERSLQFAPLQHRLQPGDRLEFTVDASQPLRPATRDVGGISFHRVVGWTGEPYNKQGEYTLNPQVQDAIEALKLPMTRFYAVGDEPFGVEGAIDRIVALVGKVGIPQEKTVLELETQSANTKLPPEVWARAARHCTDKGYRFLYWEVGNEPYIRRADSAFATPDDYVQHVKEVSAAIKQVQPGAQVGIAITESPGWGNYLLKQAAGSYDFVVGHYYAAGQVHRRKFEAIALTDNFACWSACCGSTRSSGPTTPAARSSSSTPNGAPTAPGPMASAPTTWTAMATSSVCSTAACGSSTRPVRGCSRGPAPGRCSTASTPRASPSSSSRRPRSARCSTGCTTTSTATWASRC